MHFRDGNIVELCSSGVGKLALFGSHMGTDVPGIKFSSLHSKFVLFCKSVNICSQTSVDTIQYLLLVMNIIVCRTSKHGGE
jgi:hypothetical protein